MMEGIFSLLRILSHHCSMRSSGTVGALHIDFDGGRYGVFGNGWGLLPEGRVLIPMEQARTMVKLVA